MCVCVCVFLYVCVCLCACGEEKLDFMLVYMCVWDKFLVYCVNGFDIISENLWDLLQFTVTFSQNQLMHMECMTKENSRK